VIGGSRNRRLLRGRAIGGRKADKG
jgi:hypothetical protein